MHSDSHSDSIRESTGNSDDLERTLTEKGDVEVYPDGLNVPQNEAWNGGYGEGKRGGGVVTRTSTKSSWKDPGPPPDGGWSGWTQSMFSYLDEKW